MVMPFYVVLADLVAAVHAGLIAFIVMGLVLIVVGARMGWRWVRAFWFRAVHLGAIIFVGGESLAGQACPLTTLENRLRVLGGGAGYARDFVGYWIDRLIFYDFSPRVFMFADVGCALTVAALFALVPPRLPRGRMSHRGACRHFTRGALFSRGKVR